MDIFHHGFLQGYAESSVVLSCLNWPSLKYSQWRTWHWRRCIKAWLCSSPLPSCVSSPLRCLASSEPDHSVRALFYRYGFVSVSVCVFDYCPGFVSSPVKAQDVCTWPSGASMSPITARDRQFAESAEPTPSSCAFQRPAEEIWTDVLADDGFPLCHHRQPARTRQRSPAEEGKDICRKAQNSGYTSSSLSVTTFS